MHKIMFIIGFCLSVYLFPAQQTDYVKDILKLMPVNRSADSWDHSIDQMAMERTEGTAKIGKESIPAV